MKVRTIILAIALIALLAACAPAPTPAPTAAPPTKAPAVEPTKAPVATTAPAQPTAVPPTAAPKPTDPPKPMAFSLVTGGTGGVWYPLGGAISGVVGKNVPGVSITVEATTAATDNLKLLTANKAGMAFAYDYHAGWVNDGKMPGLTGKFNTRILMAFYEQPLHVVTKDGTGIKTLEDLKGKRVSTGAPNSGTEEQAGYVLKGLSIDIDKDIKREKLGATECVAGLKDGKLDAFFWSGAVPTAAIIDLANTPGLKMVLLPIGGDVGKKIMDANPGVFHATAFKKDSYKGVDADVPTIGITAVIHVMDTFPEDRVYQIVSTLFANMKDLALVAKEVTDLTPAASMAQLGPDAQKLLHPGAVKFFKEKGALK
jgi:TRAP transporter TAXI family solute receptor